MLRYGSTLARYLWLVVAAYALLAYQDLLLHSPFAFSLSNSPGSVYARTSVILGALALIVAFQKFPIPRMRSLELAGRYSLGFFVVHKWVWYTERNPAATRSQLARLAFQSACRPADLARYVAPRIAWDRILRVAEQHEGGDAGTLARCAGRPAL